jgi:hypothetical protein
MPSKKTATGDEGKAVGFSRRFLLSELLPCAKKLSKKNRVRNALQLRQIRQI